MWNKRFMQDPKHSLYDLKDNKTNEKAAIENA